MYKVHIRSSNWVIFLRLFIRLCQYGLKSRSIVLSWYSTASVVFSSCLDFRNLSLVFPSLRLIHALILHMCLHYETWLLSSALMLSLKKKKNQHLNTQDKNQRWSFSQSKYHKAYSLSCHYVARNDWLLDLLASVAKTITPYSVKHNTQKDSVVGFARRARSNDLVTVWSYMYDLAIVQFY